MKYGGLVRDTRTASTSHERLADGRWLYTGWAHRCVSEAAQSLLVDVDLDDSLRIEPAADNESGLTEQGVDRLGERHHERASMRPRTRWTRAARRLRGREVAEAAIVAKRTPATIYNWIRQGRLYTATGTGGITLVRGDAVLDVEARMKIGRPVGAASSRWWR